MNNGNGQLTQEASGSGRSLWPWEKAVVMPEPMPGVPTTTEEAPAKPKHDRSWMRTPEGRAKLSAAIKAGWAQKRLRDARVAARRAAQDRAEETRTTDIDKAIAYHMNAIKTLQAAKALLK